MQYSFHGYYLKGQWKAKKRILNTINEKKFLKNQKRERERERERKRERERERESE